MDHIVHIVKLCILLLNFTLVRCTACSTLPINIMTWQHSALNCEKFFLNYMGFITSPDEFPSSGRAGYHEKNYSPKIRHICPTILCIFAIFFRLYPTVLLIVCFARFCIFFFILSIVLKHIWQDFAYSCLLPIVLKHFWQDSAYLYYYWLSPAVLSNRSWAGVSRWAQPPGTARQYFCHYSSY